MEIILHDIKDSEGWAIELKIGERAYYTLHYDTAEGEGVLHTEANLVGFESYDSLKTFCEQRQLTLVRDEIVRRFDFSIEITEDVPCKLVIEHWNLLVVMAKAIEASFEGEKKEYDRLYNRIFDHASGNNQLVLDKAEQARLQRVFEGKDEILDKFIPYSEEH